MLRETLAPILYVLRVSSVREGIALNNASDAGLASSIFTSDMAESHEFFCGTGNDSGMASLNTCVLRADVGVPFGGNKASGGGRTAGTDSWKNHVRRTVVTLNFAPKPEISPYLSKVLDRIGTPADAPGAQSVTSSMQPRTR